TYTYTGLVNNDPSATFSGSLATTATSSSNVGDYPITQGTLAATGNYTIGTYDPGTLTVIAAPLTVSATNESMTYGGTVPTPLTYTYTGLVNNDPSATFSGSLATTATSSSNVGDYPITQGTLAATGNYTIGTYDPGTLTVIAAPLTVSATNESMTYGGTVPTPLTYTYTGLVNNDPSATFSGSLATTATSSSNVGDYPITQGTLAATGNYTIGTYDPGTLTVIAAPLTVTATNESMTYGGTVPTLTYTYTGLVNKDTSATFSGSLATTATSSSNVGDYPITQGTLAATGNYTINTLNPSTLTVIAAPLTVSATNESMTYGGTVPTPLTYTYTGLVNNDPSATFSGSLATTATSSSNVGDYPITQGTLAATGNYTIGTYDPGTLTVIAAPLTVTATNESMTYGGTVPVLGYTYTGLVNGDISATFTGSLVTAATSSSNVGGYPITQGTLAATGNYTINTFNPGTLTVIAAPLTVTATNESMTYGGTVPVLGYTYTGLVNKDTSATFTGSLVTTATSSSNVGDYPITQGTLAATGNYTIGTYDPGTLTVIAAPLTVTATNGSMTYGGTVPVLGYTYTGLVNKDTSATFTGSLVTTATSSSNVGGYPITVGTLAATGNYTIGTYHPGTITVKPASLTITANNTTKVYGTTATLSYIAGGLVNNNTVTRVIETSAGAVSTANVGSYPILISDAVGTGLNNYNITYVDGTLKVTTNPPIAFITTLYQEILGRAPDAAGLTNWVNAVNSGDTVAQIVSGFWNSPEHLANPIGNLNTVTHDADNAFVSVLYHDMLGRTGDTGGVTSWDQVLNSNNATPNLVAMDFWNSPEHQAELKAGTAPASTYSISVTALYNELLGRSPDTSGLHVWVNIQYSGALTMNQMVQGFANSAEFVTRTSSLSTSSFVTFLYNNVLDRAPDAAGLAAWDQALNSNSVLRAQAVLDFWDSPEHTQELQQKCCHGCRDAGVRGQP